MNFLSVLMQKWLTVEGHFDIYILYSWQMKQINLTRAVDLNIFQFYNLQVGSSWKIPLLRSLLLWLQDSLAKPVVMHKICSFSVLFSPSKYMLLSNRNPVLFYRPWEKESKPRLLISDRQDSRILQSVRNEMKINSLWKGIQKDSIKKGTVSS